MECLLVVDVQERYRESADRQFCDGVAEALRRARGAGMPVVHVLHDIQADDLLHHNPLLRWVADTNARGFGQYHTVPLSCAWPAVGERVVMKRSFDSFYKTGLHQLLRELGVERINVCGLLTGMCVLSTTLSGFSRGFLMRLLSDASSDGPERYRKVVGLVYPEVAQVASVERALPRMAGPVDPRPQSLDRHRPAIRASQPDRGFRRPTSCALVVLNGRADYLPDPVRAELDTLELDFRRAGGMVFRVQTETDAQRGGGLAFQRLFGSQLPAQPRDDGAIQIPSHGVFDGPPGERLADRLAAAKVGRVALAGSISSIQVLQAVLDAFNRRYAVVVVQDRVYDPTEGRRQAHVLQCYEDQLYDTVDSDDVDDLVHDKLGLLG